MDKQLKIILTYQDMATAGLARTVSGIQGAVGGLAAGVGKGFGGLVGIVGGAIGGIKNFITGLADHMKWASFFIATAATGIGASFVNMAAGLEQTRIGFETLLKDQGKVKDALGFIQKWALETPFSVTEATDSFKRFLAVTGDLNLTKKYLQDLGDAVVATGGNINEFNFAARAMTQIQAMSKVRAQEMYQLVNANIPAFDILARAIQDGKLKVDGLNTTMTTSTGVTKTLTKEYGKAQETLKWTGAELTNAKKKLEEWIASGKHSESSMNSLRLTIQKKDAALGKAQDTINKYNSAVAISNKVVSVQKMSLDEIKGQLQDIGDLNIKGSEAAKIFSEYFEKAYGGAAKKSTESLRGQIGILKDQIVFTAAALLGYNQITGETYGLYAKLKEALSAINNFLKEHKTAFENLGKILQNNIALWGLFGVALGIAYGFLAGILAPVILAGAAFGVLGIIVGKVGERFGGWGTIIQTVQGYWNIFSQALSRFIAEVGPPILAVFDQLRPSLEQLGIALQKILPYALAFIGIMLTLAGAILTGFVTAIATALPYIVNVITGIINLVVGFFQIIGGIFTLNGELIKQGLSNMWEGIKGIFINALIAIGAFVVGFIQGVINFFKGLYNALVGGSIIPDLVNGMVTWFTTLKDRVLSLVGSLASGIRDKFLGLVGEAAGWGSGIIRNMINGIKDAIRGAGKLAGKLAGGLGMSVEDILKFQHGGIVPGPIGQPMPAVVHGGERIISRNGETGGFGGGGNITINMTGPVTLDSPERVKELAKEIKKIMGRESELSRYGLI